MIIDSYDRISFYAPVLKNLDKGLAAIKALPKMEVGRYEFEGGFFLVQEGSTKPLMEGTFEAHRKFVDVQIILEGSEEVAWDDIKNLKSEIAYNPDKDAERFALNGTPEHVMKITAGMFWVGFPADAHKPICHTSTPQTFKKIVLKLPA